MLDASIYNQKPQSFADAMSPWVQMAQARQNIEQSQAATANMQAQNPGIIAESAMKQKQAAGQAWLTDNAAKFKNEDGSINMSGLVNAAKSSGHVDLAQQIALNDAKQLSDYATAKINEATATYAPQASKAAADKASADAASATTDAVAKTWGHMSTFLKGLPPEQQAQAYMLQRAALMQQNPVVFNNATLPEYNGKNMPAIQAALEKGSMTPEVTKNLELGFGTLGVSQGNLALAQQGQGFNFASAGFTPEGKDPNSGVSRQARQIAQQAGLPVTDNMSLFDMNRIPGFAQALGQAQGAQIAPAGVRAEAVGAAATQQTTAEMLAEAAKSTRGFSKDLIGTRLGTIGGTAWQKYVTQEPRLAALGTQIQTYNSQFPNDPIDPSKLSLGEIGAKLEAGSKMLGARAKGSAKIAETQRLPSTQPAGGNNVMMINPKTGRQGPVPADQVQNLLAKGYKKL